MATKDIIARDKDIVDINMKAAIAFALILIAGLLTYIAFFK